MTRHDPSAAMAMPCRMRSQFRLASKVQRAIVMDHPITARLPARMLMPLGAMLFAACGAAPANTGGAAPSSRAVLSVEVAASQLADARCNHELACGTIGDGRTYPARNACMRENLLSVQADLAAHACPSGIATKRIDDCTGRLRQESCHPLSLLSRMYACRPAALCLQTTSIHTFDDAYGD